MCAFLELGNSGGTQHEFDIFVHPEFSIVQDPLYNLPFATTIQVFAMTNQLDVLPTAVILRPYFCAVCHPVPPEPCFIGFCLTCWKRWTGQSFLEDGSLFGVSVVCSFPKGPHTCLCSSMFNRGWSESEKHEGIQNMRKPARY